MKHLFVSIAAAIAVVAINSPAQAAPQTVTLAVPTMDCPVCPITVKKALTKVSGVSEARVDFAKREAVVTFDDARASVQKLTQATEDAGYPSSVKH